jgi:putative protease
LRAEGNVIWPDKMDSIQPGLELYRNHDHRFITSLRRTEPRRKIGVRMTFRAIPGGYQLAMKDEDGIGITRDWTCTSEPAQKPDAARASLEKQLTRLGGTEFACTGVELEVAPVPFLAVSLLNELRRNAVDELREKRRLGRPTLKATRIPNTIRYPECELNYLSNVLNRKAAAFFHRHGSEVLESAVESGLDMGGRVVMTTKYCIKHQLEACPRDGLTALPETLWLVDPSGRSLRLEFDCDACRMNVIFEGNLFPKKA